MDPLKRIETRARETMGARVRRRRKQLMLTQQELAKLSGVNQGFLSEIERGLATSSRRTIDALAIALNLPQAVLIGGPDRF